MRFLILFLVLSCTKKEGNLIDYTYIKQFDRFEERNCDFNRVTYHSLLDFNFRLPHLKKKDVSKIKNVDVYIDSKKITSYELLHSKSSLTRIYYQIDNIFGKDKHREYFEQDSKEDILQVSFFFYHNELKIEGNKEIQFKFINDKDELLFKSVKKKILFSKAIPYSDFPTFTINLTDKDFILERLPFNVLKGDEILSHYEYESKGKRHYVDIALSDSKKVIGKLPVFDKYLAFYLSRDNENVYENKIVLKDKYQCP